jgi:NTP pyrophosphatase (non-canonical NTP hydrolase)|tara:strand:+ start:198 stop:557 length:360 start_codon:yes stop_codon:yes gene_type:complete
MDDKTNINDLKDKVKKFCESRDWDQFHNAKELTIGIVTESSELLQHFRFKSDEQVNEMFQNELKRAELSEEMADILFFLVRLSQKYDIDLAAEFSKKIQKNEERYPTEKSKGSNKKYNE